ncbi:MAG: alpha/beta hydrolase [Rhodospirillaceae bacterium]
MLGSVFRTYFHTALVLLILGLTVLTGCADRRSAASVLAAGAGFQPVRFDGGEFVLAGYIRGGGAPVLTAYIEGDGLAWVSRYVLSDDPTPGHPVGLELAVADPSPSVLYLGRPCQYVMPPDDRGCSPKYWSSHRFAPEVIVAVNRAIDQAKVRTGAVRVVLVGYSGGGDVAVLAAAARSDVAALATVAAPIDHGAWTRMHNVSPLTGSLNPVDAAAGLAAMPQLHFVGGDDDIVPPAIIKDFLAHQGPAGINRLMVVPGVGHHCCWAERWPQLRRLVLQP